MNKTGLEKITEYSSAKEISQVDRLADIFERLPISVPEKIVNLGLFLRRQELSYILANYELFRLIEHVKGSIFYFGVFHGAEMMTLANLSAGLEPYNYNRRIIGFDTFTGSTKLTAHDVAEDAGFRTGYEGSYASAPTEYLEQLIGVYDENRPLAHIPKVQLVKGDIADTLPAYIHAHPQSLASMIVLTVNLYEPTRLALERLWPRLSKGGVVAIRTLNEDCFPGATKAVFDVIGTDVAIRSMPFAPNLAYIVK